MAKDTTLPISLLIVGWKVIPACPKYFKGFESASSSSSVLLSDPFYSILYKKDLFLWGSSHPGIPFSTHYAYLLNSLIIKLTDNFSTSLCFLSSLCLTILSDFNGWLDQLIKLKTSQWLFPLLLYQDSLVNTKNFFTSKKNYLDILLYSPTFLNF